MAASTHFTCLHGILFRVDVDGDSDVSPCYITRCFSYMPVWHALCSVLNVEILCLLDTYCKNAYLITGAEQCRKSLA